MDHATESSVNPNEFPITKSRRVGVKHIEIVLQDSDCFNHFPTSKGKCKDLGNERGPLPLCPESELGVPSGASEKDSGKGWSHLL